MVKETIPMQLKVPKMNLFYTRVLGLTTRSMELVSNNMQRSVNIMATGKTDRDTAKVS